MDMTSSAVLVCTAPSNLRLAQDCKAPIMTAPDCSLSRLSCMLLSEVRAMLTCHGRQKTIDEKTYCPCYNSAKRIVGGKGRGFWCGSCLYIRMGENIHEVKHRRDWRCPCCRDICNCSGANCLRARRNLAVTNQLIHEATKQGFKSVSLYPLPTAVI